MPGRSRNSNVLPRLLVERGIFATALLAPLLLASRPAQADEDLCSKVSLAATPAQPVKIRYGLTGGGEEPLALLWADKERYPNQGRFYALEPQLFSANDRMTAVQAGQLDAGSISLTALITSVRAFSAGSIATGCGFSSEPKRMCS